MFSQWISLMPMTFSCNKCVDIGTGLMGLSIQTLKKQNWIEFSWRTTVYIAKFNVKPRLEHEFPIEWTYFQWF